LARLKNGSRIVQLQRDAYRLSITDPLLGVFNRRYLINQLRCEIWRARRYQHSLTVLMADLDYFKQVNDRYGHAVGDQVLVGFTRRARSLIRETDWLARSGGEEFVFVLPDTPVAEGLNVAQKVRKDLAAGPFLTRAGELTVTASFGVAELAPGMREDTDALLGRADAATYQSKDQGRNRVTVATESSKAAFHT
jgi:diguanylate cyclase (GGDEF)-like protein